ncbi:hypothetical protein EDD79_100980 [Serpentinicella alkaliphila]|uniref:DUF1850 domain-containing protein n=2 Tax=Serpentinicella alkaliphila TaxID=1734049 RepID=A0A4R2TQA4_9FIRM|nr:hypothetical protein EDD79_100980 [Serpentinicella alkaliphila]
MLNATMMKLNNRLLGDGHRCNTCPFLLLIVFTVIIVLSIYLVKPVYAVQIIYNNEVSQTLVVDPHKEIYIDYTHSVARTNIRDVFVFKKSERFLLIRTEYSSFGAGLPTESFGRFTHRDGLYINEGINLELQEIPIRIGTIANHKLTFQDGSNIVFSDFFKTGELVVLKPAKINRLEALVVKGGM